MPSLLPPADDRPAMPSWHDGWLRRRPTAMHALLKLRRAGRSCVLNKGRVMFCAAWAAIDGDLVDDSLGRRDPECRRRRWRPFYRLRSKNREAGLARGSVNDSLDAIDGCSNGRIFAAAFEEQCQSPLLIGELICR